MIPLSHFFLLSGTLVTLVGTEGGGGKRGENEVRRYERQESESGGTHLKGQWHESLALNNCTYTGRAYRFLGVP
jgi:hypothetical protein